MYCGNCGKKLNENDHFCGLCGMKVAPKIVYVEEQPLEPIYNNTVVVLLTFFFLFLAFATIIGTAFVTKSFPATNSLRGDLSSVIY